MQKFLAAVFIGVFLLSSSIGFGVSRQVKALSSKSNQAVSPSNQKNFLLVHVDDKNKPDPQLISVWGFFISRSDFPSVIMKRLFPEAGSQTSGKLNQSFSLNSKKQPSARFMDVVNGLGLPALKIAVVDDPSAVDWANGLADQLIGDSASVSRLSTNLEKAQSIDQQLFINACSAIEKRTSGISPVSSYTQLELKRSPLISFSNDFLEWKGLVTSLHLSSCEMLVGP